MTGRVLLVGGSGGLGAATAKLLAAAGAKLLVSYFSDVARADSLSSIARVVQADIRSADDRVRLLNEAGPIDALVVFAGHPARVAPEDDLEAKMRVSHEVNYAGPILLARETAERMRSSDIPGAIVLFSTMQGVAIFPNSSVYAGPKAALIHAARILAKEVRGHNIRVNVISPGVMAAGMAEASIASGKYDSYLQDKTIARFGRAEDIARTVQFLLEPDNYVTGQVISVDGGITL